MHIDTCYTKRGDKTYCRHLLRQSYREDGKVKHRTLANLSDCSPEEINALKLALKHKRDLSVLGTIDDLTLKQGLRIGAVFCLRAIAQRVGLTQALGSHQAGRLALWQVLARLIDQGSRLSAVRLAQRHAACDILNLESFNEDDLYDNLAWLAQHQEAIEQRLFRRRWGSAPPHLFLYDVTSSYLEGVQNILAAFGYNRDGKKGKQQLVIGLLTGPDGTPVAVRVFAGNTQDPQTVPQQIRTLADRFGVKKVTLVGDRGMLKQPQLDQLDEKHFHYITAITKAQIRKLLKQQVIQMSLFDEPVVEVQDGTVRYILRRNPQRAQELARSRQDKLAAVHRLLAQQNQYLAEHPRAVPDVAQRRVTQRAQQLKIDGWAKVTVDGRTLGLDIDQAAQQQASQLDGCYVIKSDLPAELASSQIIHDRYRDLIQVERAFRTFKSGHLELRPIFVRTEASTRGHVFVVMLAYLLERELDQCWRQLEVTVPEGLDELGSLRGVEISLGQTRCQKVPRPTGLSEQLLRAADVELPSVLPLRKVAVATRKTLVSQRKVP